MTMRGFVAAALLALCGCVACRDRIEVCHGVDFSDDHRLFRIASVSKLMLEPVLWKLEDDGTIDFDRPVTSYFKDPLPVEFASVTLRDLHDNRSGLPREFIDPWSLSDMCTVAASGLVGANLYAAFDSRASFVRKLWDPRVRGDVRRKVPRYSNMGYVLLMMAITDRLGLTAEELCQKHLVEPYGLTDTTFAEDLSRYGERLTRPCAGALPWLYPAGCLVADHRGGTVTHLAGGMVSSAADVLKVCRAILPRVARARGILESRVTADGRTLLYRYGMIYGGHSFVGFDPEGGHVAVILKNVTCWNAEEGFDLLLKGTPKRP